MVTGTLLVVGADQVRRLRKRYEALRAQGASDSDGAGGWAWYLWETASLAVSEALGRVLIAADVDCRDGDWQACCDMLDLIGVTTSNPMYADIGEPGFDPVSRVWIWLLTRP